MTQTDIIFLLPVLTVTTIIALVFQRDHLLIRLLILERIILTLAFLLIILSGNFNNEETFIAIILLTFGACEARLGLALLVSIIRNYGTDLIYALTISKC